MENSKEVANSAEQISVSDNEVIPQGEEEDLESLRI